MNPGIQIPQNKSPATQLLEVNPLKIQLLDMMAAEQKKTNALDGTQRAINYTFTDREILWEALQVPGAITAYSTTNRNFTNGNKRLALLGDTIGKSALLARWYQTTAIRGLLFPVPMSSGIND